MGSLDDIKSFVNSITSGQCSDEVYATRLSSCTSCPKLLQIAGRKFCTGCSCGTWMLAELDGAFLPKLRWSDLKCPLARPGFSNS